MDFLSRQKSEDLVAPEEPLSFQCLVWNIQEPEVIIAALQDHTHGFSRQPCSLRETNINKA